MPKTSAGLLMYRVCGSDLQVLLAHPGGPFWRNKDEGVWTIPKGELGVDEDALACAQREFAEETGIAPHGPFIDLGQVRQSGGKIVHAWAFRGDCDPAAIRSNTFTMQWPPKSGRMLEFPEIDRAEFFDLQAARGKINPAQAEFVDRLEHHQVAP